MCVEYSVHAIRQSNHREGDTEFSKQNRGKKKSVPEKAKGVHTRHGTLQTTEVRKRAGGERGTVWEKKEKTDRSSPLLSSPVPCYLF